LIAPAQLTAAGRAPQT